MPQSHRAKVLVAGTAVFLFLCVAILLGLSLQGVDYYEMAFQRRRTTGRVDLNTLYHQGLYFVGPDVEFKTFPSIAHTEHFNRITVFTSDRLEVTITCSLQYFLRPHQLPNLHRNFDIHYKPVMTNNALDALKGEATYFSTDDFIWNRQAVEKAILLAVTKRLGGKCCELGCENRDNCLDKCIPYETCNEDDWGLFVEVRYFQLGRVDIPNDLNIRYIRALVLQEEAKTEQYKQDAQLVRKETTKLVQDINNEARVIANNATAQSDLIKSVANAEAKAIVEDARGQGLQHLYNEIGITSKDHKATFDYLRAIKSNTKAKLTVGYNQMISAKLK